MKSKLAKPSRIDFEAFGSETMRTVGDESAAMNICALEIHAYADALKPEMADLAQEAVQVRNRWLSLWTHLYDHEAPVSDAAMLVHGIEAGILAVLVVFTALASIAANTIMFNLIGDWMLVSIILGVALTSLTAAIGYRFHRTILGTNAVIEAIASMLAFALMFWGVFEIAQARGPLIDKLMTPAATSSFVDENNTDNAREESSTAQPSTEVRVRNFLHSGQMKIMLAAEFIVGIFLGLLVEKWTDEDFVAWQKLKKMSHELRQLARRMHELQSSIEIAKTRCMAGILRAKHRPRKRHVPYHRALPVFLLAFVLIASPCVAQTIERHEAILIDVSGSIGKGGANSELFRDYLVAAKQLLLTEPPLSRVWVSTITTDSFGSVRSIVKGWTPEVHGVFDDDLIRARHELAASFESKSAGLQPAAAGTDIIGGLWHATALLESGAKGNTVAKSIWILSDMMNESASFNMPALMPLGPEEMLARAKANGLVVPLRGYQVHVIGASPAGLTPQAWNTIRTFWTLYFREAGAEVVSYSLETAVDRD